jgi:serine/threonine protein kinase
MLNMADATNSVAITREFDAETALLSDPQRLPAHRHVMVVLHSFTDTATGLPSWDFEADIVNPRTMFVIMPFFTDDLKRVYKRTRQQGRTFGELRAVKIVHDLLRAVRHLKQHGIVHRDVKCVEL